MGGGGGGPGDLGQGAGRGATLLRDAPGLCPKDTSTSGGSQRTAGTEDRRGEGQ